MSWHFSQALEVEFLRGNYSDGEQLLRWSSIPFAQDDLCSAKMKGTFHRSPYGTMFVHSTDILGVELLTWYLEVSRVRTSVRQGKETDWMGNVVVYGRRCLGLLAKLDPTTYSWKTAQCSLLEDLELCFQTWPEWGSMRNGECWEREIPMLPIYEKGSGYWHTPTANDCKPAGPKEIEMVKKWEEGQSIPNTYIRLRSQVAVRSNIAGPVNPNWSEWLMGWPEGWTGLEPLETGKFQEWQQQHGGF